MARNINDDVTLAYLFKKTKEKLEAAIGVINNTLTQITTNMPAWVYANISYVSGETAEDKLARLLEGDYLPRGRPFIGWVQAGSRYFVAGYLYTDGDELYGSMLFHSISSYMGGLYGINNWNIQKQSIRPDDVVKKAGDTMTGDLTIRKRGPNFDMVNTDADTSAATTTAVRYWTAGHFDKNNKYASYWQTEFNTAGRVTTSLGARRIVNGSNVSNSINLVVNADGTFQVGVNSPQAWRTALGVAAYTEGKWTPKIYDYETYKFDLPAQWYFKIGNLCVMFISTSPFPNTTFNTMIAIRNLPCRYTISGAVYMARASGEGGTWTVQGAGTNVYLRPNFAGTINGGIFTAVFLGYD